MTIHGIRFRQSGGVTGLVRGCELGSADLTASDRSALERHAAKAGGTESSAAPGAYDRVVYELFVQTDTGTRRLQFDETSLPADLADLVDRLVRKAHPVKP